MAYSEPAYIAALRRIYTPPNLAYRHSLSLSELFKIRSNFFLQLFKACQLDEQKVILVSGTKGKGSTVEFIASGLMAQVGMCYLQCSVRCVVSGV
ncbi:hypothetical protein EON63_11435 [archaeon]|nr:MAG: hypothetical protein EON63_11435 [archaeon]